MSLYTPPSLPRTPSSYASSMNATLPSLQTDLLAWSTAWRSNTSKLLTPPMTSTFESRRMNLPKVQMTLPPITTFERLAPLTPPEDVINPPSKFSPPSPALDKDEPMPPAPETEYSQPKPPQFSDAPYADWLLDSASRSRSANSIAEKTCEMICYLWFATSSPEQRSSSTNTYPTPNNSPPFSSRPNPSTSTLQLNASTVFVQFMQKLLETTQVSQSVIVLSLHYIWKLKVRNHFTPAQQGSEFRIAVAGLMMANKFLDDNTYTNKTWSEVSGIDLVEINRMEKEFLMGVDFNLYVDKATYESWLNLLKGLVLAKERDSRHFRKSRSGGVRAAAKHLSPSSSHQHSSYQSNHHLPVHASTGPASRTYSTHSSSSARHRATYPHRARSTSPGKSLPLPYPVYAPAPIVPEPASPSPLPSTAKSGAKRSAADAFSPSSASFSHLPSKRPVSISLQIPEFTSSGGNASTGSSAGPHSHSPLEGLSSFGAMSIDSPARPRQQGQNQNRRTTAQQMDEVPLTRRHAIQPETLVAPYSLDEEKRKNVPQNLYFYTLACSPMDKEDETAERARKARLRYHQPTQSQSQTILPHFSTHFNWEHPIATATTNSSTGAHANHFHDTPSRFPAPTASHHQNQNQNQNPYYHHHVHQLTVPPVVQSASTSPHESHIHLVPMHQQHQQQQQQGQRLPHFSDMRWSRSVALPLPTSNSGSNPICDNGTRTQHAHVYGHTHNHPASAASSPLMSNTGVTGTRYTNQRTHTESPVPSAQFANAGPPGVHFSYYASTPAPVHHPSSVYPPNWASVAGVSYGRGGKRW